MPTKIKKPLVKISAKSKTKKKSSSVKVAKTKSSAKSRVVKVKSKTKPKAKIKRTTTKSKATKPKILAKTSSKGKKHTVAPATKKPSVQIMPSVAPTPVRQQQTIPPVVTSKPVFISEEPFHDWHSLKREAAELMSVSDANEFEDLLVTLFQKSSSLTSQDVSRALRVLEEVVFVPQPIGFGGQGFSPRRHKHTNIDHLVLLRAAMKAGQNSANIIQGIIYAGLTDARTVVEAQGRAGHFEREKMH